MTEDFSDKAQRLLSKLNSISNTTMNSRKVQTSSQLTKTNNAHNQNSLPSLNQLVKFQQQIDLCQDQNQRKFRHLHEQILKLESWAIEEHQSRNKMSENFILTTVKVQKNMKNMLNGVHKSFEQKEKKLQQKIDNLLNNEKKQIESQLSQNENLINQIQRISQNLMTLQAQIQTLRKSRFQLQEKIYKQFTEQLKELKRIYQRDLKQRDQRQLSMVQKIKQLYQQFMEEVRCEQKQREQNQKMFLTVVQQIINRIVQA